MLRRQCSTAYFMAMACRTWLRRRVDPNEAGMRNQSSRYNSMTVLPMPLRWWRSITQLVTLRSAGSVKRSTVRGSGKLWNPNSLLNRCPQVRYHSKGLRPCHTSQRCASPEAGSLKFSRSPTGVWGLAGQ